MSDSVTFLCPFFFALSTALAISELLQEDVSTPSDFKSARAWLISALVTPDTELFSALVEADADELELLVSLELADELLAAAPLSSVDEVFVGVVADAPFSSDAFNSKP